MFLDRVCANMAHIRFIISIKGTGNANNRGVKSPDNPDHNVETPLSKETVSKASSELNNLLQIISGTSAELANLWEGKDGSERYLSLLRQSVARAETVAGQLAEHAGSTNRKMAIHPELAPFAPQDKKVSIMPVSKPQVLVVDDEEVALMLLKQLLTTAGYQVSTAQSGFECLDLFRRRPLSYRLVLLDLTMPFMDGEETFHRLREINSEVPVMLCTGFIQNERLEKLMAAGLSGFLRKPFAPEEILGHIQALLESVKYARVTGESPSLTA
jgi:CheY-like chemotaxis protein